jgi:hypothetical protein
VSYVDAGYAIVLGVLALYALSLITRRRRLERAARLVTERGGFSRELTAREVARGNDTVRADDEPARDPLP